MSNFSYCYKLSHRRYRLLKRWGLVNVLERQKLIFRFESENHAIDLRTLTDGFGGFCHLLYLLNQTNQDATDIDIKVEAIKPGSFEISVELWELATIIAGTVVVEGKFKWTIDNLWKLLGQFLKLAKALDGEKADKIEQISDSQVLIIKGNENHVINTNTYNIYMNNQPISGTLTNSSCAMLRDGAVSGWSVEKPAPDGSVESISASREDLKAFAKRNVYLLGDNTEIVQRDSATLVLNTAKLDGTGKWRFTYKGKKISADIRDIVFVDRVTHGEIRFGHGDVFIVNMEVQQSYSHETQSWHDKSYSILSVLNHESTAGRESNLFDKDELVSEVQT